MSIITARKKPVEIKAMQLTPESMSEALDWMGCNACRSNSPHGIIITTLEGDMHASWNDYIIQGVNGEFYPCKPDIFEKTYDIIEG